MADRATVNKATLLAPEVTAGTPVATVNKQLQATSFEPAVQADIKMFGPVGSEFDTISQLTREWSTTRVTQEIASFTDLVYLWLMWCASVTPVTPSGGTTSKEWIFAPSDVIQPMTIDTGDFTTDGAERTAYNVANDFNMEFSKGGVSAGATLFGRRVTRPVTLHATPAPVSQIALDPNNMDFFLSTVNQAGLAGATALDAGFRAMFRMSGRWAPVWPVGSAYTSFARHIKRKPTVEFGLQMGADAAGFALLPIMRANSPVWFRVRCTGPLIEGAINYLFELDIAARIKSAPDTGDLDGVDTLTWTAGIVKDTTWGFPFKARIINLLAAA